MIHISFFMTIEKLDKITNSTLDKVSKNVIKYRKEKNYSQLQLALDIGMTGNAFIARAEKRKDNNHFNIEHIVKIASVLDIEIARFFE